MASIKYIAALITCAECKQENRVLISSKTDQRIKCGKCKTYLLHYELVRGYVYVLSNSHMPGLVKIGFTEKSVVARVKELSAATGVPAGFEVEAFFGSRNPQEEELLVHKTLINHKRPGKEFFALSPDSAINRITSILRRKPLFMKTVHGDFEDFVSKNEGRIDF